MPVPPPPINLEWRLAVSSLLTAADLTYRGAWKITNASGAGNFGNVGQTWSRGQCCFRYVNGERRLLALAANPSWGPSNAHPGTLWEFRLPAPGPVNAPTELQALRSWPLWESGFYYDTNGVNIGGIWYDAEWNVLWHTIYSTYEGPSDPPFLGATRLNDDGTVTKFGPWKHPLGGKWYRTSSWWIYGAPPSVKAQNPDAEMCLGGAVGSTAQNGNWGPGLHWYQRPALSTSGRLMTWGPLMDYSTARPNHAPVPQNFCKRAPTYDCEPGSGGFHKPQNGVGFWCASIDQISGHVWMETPTRHGIIALGRMVSPGRYIWYAGNPKVVNGAEHYDRGSNAGNSYKAGVAWPTGDDGKAGSEPALLIFPPDQALGVMAGTRPLHAVDFVEQANWRTRWNLPLRPGTPTPYGVANYPNPGSWQCFDSPQGQPSTSAADPLTGEFVWGLPSTQAATGNFPTFHLFKVAV